jgi:hypothetical protein
MLLCYYFSYLGIRYIHTVCYLSSPLVHTPQMDMQLYNLTIIHFALEYLITVLYIS